MHLPFRRARPAEPRPTHARGRRAAHARALRFLYAHLPLLFPIANLRHSCESLRSSFALPSLFLRSPLSSLPVFLSLHSVLPEPILLPSPPSNSLFRRSYETPPYPHSPIESRPRVRPRARCPVPAGCGDGVARRVHGRRGRVGERVCGYWKTRCVGGVGWVPETW
ncbi:hypothetical protein NEOLEDRAFT_122796 [Neolentinus lepideus HHB14362 ss-1]|uniref:Uncharacterized protein n=1 Tax=Neolentinus lepideus HHB14362 ss-1 TaxID=1314782 RepID=A0A165MSN5_9AGAM|nr:hypothetical protein NEOLEDRAFT_122796 [Neolentinus lepideus HHB14362 ss-1]